MFVLLGKRHLSCSTKMSCLQSIILEYFVMMLLGVRCRQMACFGVLTRYHDFLRQCSVTSFVFAYKEERRLKVGKSNETQFLIKHLIIDFIPLNSVDKLLFAKLDTESHVLWLYMSVLVYPDIFKLQIIFPQHARMVPPRHHGATALSRARSGMTKGGRGLCGKT